MLAAAAGLYIASMFAKDGALAVLVPCLLLWAQLYTLGILSEGRPYAQILEFLRLAVVLPLGVLVLQYTTADLQIALTGWITLVIYVLASALWLRRN